jgi:riboflavin biosynthesis pyrimidine reductase
VVSGSGTIDPGVRIFQTRSSPLILLTAQSAPAKKLARLRELADAVKIFGETEVDFRSALAWLHQIYGVKRLLCEGGAELNDALFRADLVDEIHLTICPRIFGGRTTPTISEGDGFKQLALTARFKLASARNFKGELFTTFLRAKNTAT